MKKLFLFFLFYNSLYAASVGNPSDPAIIEKGFFISDTSLINLRTSFELNNIQNERMKLSDFWQSQEYAIKKSSSLLTLWGLTINYKDRFDLYESVGFDKMEISISAPSHFYEIQSKSNFYYRTGFKIILLQILRNMTLSIDVKYAIFHSKGANLLDNQIPRAIQNTSFHFKEWQISPGIAYDTKLITPYFGLVFRDTRIRLKQLPFISESVMKLKFLHKTGLVLGAALCSGRYFALTLEARFINEQSFNFFAEIRF